MDSRDFFAGGFDEGGVFVRRIVTVHQLQNPVAAVLQREVQKAADLRLGGHDVEQPPVVGRRFGRAEPDAEISVDSGHGMDQLTEAPSGVGVGRRC